MYDNGEPAATRPKDSFTTDSKSTETQKLETLSTTKLLDLNDDCLDYIFNHLDVIELCSVTQVCKRLQQLAELHFKRKHSKLNFQKLFVGRLILNQEAGDIFRNFGPMIELVSISRESFHNNNAVGHVEEELLKDIVECCGEKLHSLRIFAFCFTSHAVELLNMLSRSLESLTLVICGLDADCVFHLSNFSSLKELSLALTTDTLACFALMGLFPALEYLRLDKVSISSSCILHHFFFTHKQLKKLIIRFCEGISSDVFRFIGKYLENLKLITFDGNLIQGSESTEQIRNNVVHLSELKNLQALIGCYCDFLSIVNLLAKMVSNKLQIKVLAITAVDDETVEAIGKMKNLESLGFLNSSGLKDRHLFKIARELTQLKELYIDTKPHQNIKFEVLKVVLCYTKQLMELRIRFEKFRLDHTSYNDVLDIVKKRGNGIKLTLKIYSPYVQDLIPQQTINMNKNWLIINHSTSMCSIFHQKMVTLFWK